MNQLLHPELSYKILGVVFRVYNDLGYGYQEKYYQRAIALEFDKLGLKYMREKILNLQYEGKNIGKYVLDFIIEDKIVLELKIAYRFHPNHVRQILAYLKSSGLELGILVIFNKNGVKFKRILRSLK